jgi:hypothetical protein
MSIKSEKLAKQQAALEYLRTILKPGDEVYVKVERVAHSGMSRCLSAYRGTSSAVSYVENITNSVALANGDQLSREGWIRVYGCGMDMCFDLVYRLSYALYPEGYDCIDPEGMKHWDVPRERRCPHNDHSNGAAGGLVMRRHRRSGYALSYRSL